MCITDNNYSFVGCLLSIAPSKIKITYFNNWFICIVILILLRGVTWELVPQPRTNIHFNSRSYSTVEF